MPLKTTTRRSTPRVPVQPGKPDENGVFLSVDLVSNLTAKHWLERSEAMLHRRDLPAATASFFHSEHLGADPDRCSSGRWLAAMLSGNYDAAWRESDAICKRGAPDANRFWQGEDITGKRVIVRCLHGLGDAVQMFQYAPKLARMTRELIFEVPPALLEIATCFAGVDRVITWGGRAPADPPEWDVQIEVAELPYLFRTKFAELPLARSPLTLPQTLIEQTQSAMGRTNRLRVGLVWEAGDWNPTRSIPFRLLAPLFEHEHIEFWNLQGGPSAEQANSTNLKNAEMICGRGVLPLAATIANLDLVITVDTLAAHLAGSLGKTAWVLLQQRSDWRWMTVRHDSPWYPSLRLFRQPTQDDWPTLLQTLSAALENLVSPRNPEERISG